MTLGPPLLPMCAVRSWNVFSPHVRSAPRAHADREHRCRHIEHLLLECRVFWARQARWRLHFSGMTSWACLGSAHASAVLLAPFPSDCTPVVAATACLVPFLPDPAATLGRPPPWRLKLQCVSLVAAFLLCVLSAACTRLPPSESMLASLRLPAWSSVHSWLLCLRSGPLSAPALLPAPTPVMHMSAPVRRGAVADARLGLA